MAGKEPTDREIDAMIDESIKKSKADKPKEEKHEKKDSGKSEASTPKPSEQKADRKKAKPAPKAVEGYDPWTVLRHPHLTEKSMNLVERNNVLVFIVSMKADKAKVKEAVEKGFGVNVEKVRM